MERGSWTDERIGDFARNVDRRFDAVDARFDRVDARFDRVDARLDRVDADIRDLGVELRGEIGALRITLIRVGGGLMTGLVGVIVATLLNSG